MSVIEETVSRSIHSPTDILGLDWDAYARYYDSMCEINPSYKENVDLLKNFIGSWELGDRPDVCDLGAGTGNYICELSELLPDANFTHVDFDRLMNLRAAAKYELSGVRNVEIVESDLQSVAFSSGSFDLIICINALYAISPQRMQLLKMREWLKKGGRLFLIDFGRKMRVLDWAMYIFRNSVKKRGLKETISWYRDNYEVVRQNRQGSKAQETGEYWLHTTDEFQDMLESCGYRCEQVFPCYRGCADLAVCTVL